METKKMTVADVNIVFGEKEEPLLCRVDDIILPALTQEIAKRVGKDTRFFFTNVEIKDLGEKDLAICGLLIKDTYIEVRSEYDENRGLIPTKKEMKSAPYSLFIIYLKNHRMMLVKNQKGSPDLRSFNSALSKNINRYVTEENRKRKIEDEELLPRPHIAIHGIKTAQNVKDILKNVEKIENITLKFNPLNAEWDMNSLWGEIDGVRKIVGSKTGRMILNSPENIDGVAELIENSEGMIETQMKVRYSDNLSFSGSKKKATIKETQISEDMSIDIEDDLEYAYNEIYAYKKDIASLNVESKNNVLLYEEFIKRRRVK